MLLDVYLAEVADLRFRIGEHTALRMIDSVALLAALDRARSLALAAIPIVAVALRRVRRRKSVALLLDAVLRGHFLQQDETVLDCLVEFLLCFLLREAINSCQMPYYTIVVW